MRVRLCCHVLCACRPPLPPLAVSPFDFLGIGTPPPSPSSHLSLPLLPSPLPSPPFSPPPPPTTPSPSFPLPLPRLPAPPLSPVPQPRPTSPPSPSPSWPASCARCRRTSESPRAGRSAPPARRAGPGLDAAGERAGGGGGGGGVTCMIDDDEMCMLRRGLGCRQGEASRGWFRIWVWRCGSGGGVAARDPRVAGSLRRARPRPRGS